ncbi:uncharacterized protein LOC120977724 isoform X3 [Bufo bufo]|uniref:uncharacterized protein LOC120977724 isoform X3 n=1 Tax=Bufo bufo TaxID=8384 RepID=UPI001ABE131C|nr:uncharacterized protein LOC120977724 isoform X3 [Bufo bufo]
MPEGEIIDFLAISLARTSGTMLLAVYNYNSPRALVSRSALGTLLIILCMVFAQIGDWMDEFQLASFSSVSGSPKKVIMYVSDCDVTSQIIDQVGPIAVRPLPKGVNIHSGQLFPEMLSKVNGILLDEDNNNDNEFTVVDCTEIKMGVIDFIKVGTVPKTQVT